MVKKKDKTLFAFVTTFLSIVGFIIALLAWKKDKYVMHYAKISLAVFIISVIASIIGGIFMFIPVLGMIINVGLNIIVFVIWLVSWIYALSGEEKGIPLVSDLAKKFKF